MGINKFGVPRRMYFDSNIFIYAIEGNGEIANLLHRLFKVLRDRQGFAVTSELSLAEVLPKADVKQRRDYLDLIAESGIFELSAVNRDILIETANYRRASGMPKLADAIHVVTAIRYECRTILSGDLRMKLPPGQSLIDANALSVSRLIQELA